MIPPNSRAAQTCKWISVCVPLQVRGEIHKAAATPATAQYYHYGYSPYSYGYSAYSNGYSYPGYSYPSYGYSYPSSSYSYPSYAYSYPSYGYSYPSYSYGSTYGYSYPAYRQHSSCLRRHHRNGVVWYTRSC